MAEIESWLNRPASGHRSIYVCDWLPPDFGAVGQYSLQFSRERAAAGEDVLLVGFSSASPSTEVEIHGSGRLTILKIKVDEYNKSSLLARSIWTAKINLRMMLLLAGLFRKADEIIFTGSPPFMVHWIAPLNLVMRRKVVYRITDFYPECLIATRTRKSVALELLRRLTMFWRKRIPVMEVLGEDQRSILLRAGIRPEKIRMKRDPSPVSIPEGTLPMELPEGLQNRCVLLYSGNFGVAHDRDTFVNGYVKHHRDGSGKVVLWLNAVGSGADAVEKQLRAENVPVIRGKPVPIEQLPSLLMAPYAHLITLRNEFVGFVMPSKVYGCIESKKHVLYVGPQTSDVHLLCQQGLDSEKYLQVEVENAAGVSESLENLARTWSEASGPVISNASQVIA